MTIKSRIGTMVNTTAAEGDYRIHLGVVDGSTKIALVIEGINPPTEAVAYIQDLGQAKQLLESLGNIIRKLDYGMSAEETAKSFKPH